MGGWMGVGGFGGICVLWLGTFGIGLLCLYGFLWGIERWIKSLDEIRLPQLSLYLSIYSLWLNFPNHHQPSITQANTPTKNTCSLDHYQSPIITLIIIKNF